MRLQSANPVRRREDDRFGRWGFACAVADLVDGASPGGAVVVGIEGAWGSGKSSVMEMTAGVLGDAGGHRVIRVSAWRTTSQDQFLASLAYGIAFALRRDWSSVWMRLLWARMRRQPLPTWLGLLFPAGFVAALVYVPGLSERVKPFAKTDLASILASLGMVGAPFVGLLITYAARPVMSSFRGLLGRDGLAEKSGAMEQFAYEFDVLAEAQSGRARFVVMVEDLDRASPERVADVLGAVAQLCGHERADRLAFLLAYDREKVLSAVEASLKKTSPDIVDPKSAALAQVDRVIQVGLPLPAMDRRAGPGEDRGRALRFPGPLQALLIATVAVVATCHALLADAPFPFVLDLLAVGAGLAFVVGVLLTTHAFDARAGAPDAEWQSAAEALRPLMPENPRDAVRVTNLARAARALDADPGRLTRTEALAIAAAVERYPHVLNVDMIRAALPDGRLGPGAFRNAEFAGILADLSRNGVDTGCFDDANRLHRYFRAVRGAEAPVTA